jgi:hypothetical protein
MPKRLNLTIGSIAPVLTILSSEDRQKWPTSINRPAEGAGSLAAWQAGAFGGAVNNRWRFPAFLNTVISTFDELKPPENSP